MFRKASSTRSLRTVRGCAGRGSATSPTGSASSRTIAASRFSRSAPSSGRCSSSMRWWRPTTGSSAERIAKPPVPAKRSSGTRRPAAPLRAATVRQPLLPAFDSERRDCRSGRGLSHRPPPQELLRPRPPPSRPRRATRPAGPASAACGLADPPGGRFVRRGFLIRVLDRRRVSRQSRVPTRFVQKYTVRARRGRGVELGGVGVLAGHGQARGAGCVPVRTEPRRTGAPGMAWARCIGDAPSGASC